MLLYASILVYISAALQMKILTPFSGLRYLEWIGRMKQQFQEDMLQQEGEAHVYAGLAYLDENDGIRYLQFGKQYAAWQKHQDNSIRALSGSGREGRAVFLQRRENSVSIIWPSTTTGIKCYGIIILDGSRSVLFVSLFQCLQKVM